MGGTIFGSVFFTVIDNQQHEIKLQNQVRIRLSYEEAKFNYDT